MGFLSKREFDRLWLDVMTGVFREFPEEPEFKTAIRLRSVAQDLTAAAQVLATMAFEKGKLEPTDAVAVGKAFYYDLLRERFPGAGSDNLRNHGTLADVVTSLATRYPAATISAFPTVVSQILNEFVVMRGPLKSP